MVCCSLDCLRYGLGICGFSVGILWPGTISISSARLPRGGTAMFALLAKAGDLGGGLFIFLYSQPGFSDSALRWRVSRDWTACRTSAPS